MVEQDEQQDLFVTNPWHVHLVDINLRLDVPLERTLCGDLLPSRPVYREVTRQALRGLCPACLAMAGEQRQVRRSVLRSTERGGGAMQIELSGVERS